MVVRAEVVELTIAQLQPGDLARQVKVLQVAPSTEVKIITWVVAEALAL
jgi:hypothetical protein